MPALQRRLRSGWGERWTVRTEHYHRSTDIRLLHYSDNMAFAALLMDPPGDRAYSPLIPACAVARATRTTAKDKAIGNANTKPLLGSDDTLSPLCTSIVWTQS